MKTKEARSTAQHKIANLSAVILVVFLGAGSFIESIYPGSKIAGMESMIVFSTALTLILLFPLFKLSENVSRNAIYVPLVLFLFNTVIMQLGGMFSYNYFFICLCISVISCLYSNFSRTLIFTIVQAITIGILYLTKFPITGPGSPWYTVTVAWGVFAFASVALLMLTRLITDNLKKALDDKNSFRIFLDTTMSHLAMVDKSNRIRYISKPLLDLVGITAPELAHGRSFIDIFPNRELKVMAGKMLNKRQLYEDEWEFELDGHRRYFNAASNTLTGSSPGTLINLHDNTYLAERDELAAMWEEITAMKDNLKIGLFFMNRDYIIQDNHSRHLEELLSDSQPNGKKFTDILSDSLSARELESVKDYFGMVFDQTFDQTTLEEINPLHELRYVNPETKNTKIFQCEFVAIEQELKEVFILVVIYDITARVELQRRLKEEESRRHEAMSSLFELIQVNPTVFTDFLSDVEYEFSRIDEILKNDKLSAHETLVEVYQSVHAIKSNSVILGLATFGNKVHALETVIKQLREMESEVTFDDMLHLTVEIERLAEEKEGFKDVIQKIDSFKAGSGSGQKQNEHILVETLNKTVCKVAEDLEKKARFVVTGIDSTAIEDSSRRVMKEVLVQLIRNSVVHGIETPEERLAKGKDETGTIRLSIKTMADTIQIKLSDDGKGLDFNKIREKALEKNLIQDADKENRNALLQAIFSPGFSTATNEGMHGGRGIGLNLVRDRVRSAKGSIEVQTELGKGTVFNITLPLSSASRQ
ncbi:MAG TPA: hypothetical protein DEQ14_02215 [Treponema sp.]|nr:hypothetical protein [Treponema sp.]